MAFEFFKEKIITNDSLGYLVEKRLFESDLEYFRPGCLKNFDNGRVLKVQNTYKFLTNPVGLFAATDNHSIPFVQVSKPYSNKPKQYFVVIKYATLASGGFNYYIELSDAGKIVNWCETKYFE